MLLACYIHPGTRRGHVWRVRGNSSVKGLFVLVEANRGTNCLRWRTLLPREIVPLCAMVWCSNPFCKFDGFELGKTLPARVLILCNVSHASVPPKACGLFTVSQLSEYRAISYNHKSENPPCARKRKNSSVTTFMPALQ
jgi:hypothetical protein